MLDEIVARTRAEVEVRKWAMPADKFQLDSETRSLKASLRARSTGMGNKAVITEIKPASPSEGKICDVDVPETARAMEAGGACALSVLTEPFYFGGSLENLRKAKAAVKIPVMRKDFIVDEYQLFEAKHYGADAVLLMVSVLGNRTKQFYEAARRLGMEALVEVHDVNELKAALGSGAELIGINNRDLKTMKINLNATKELSDKIRKMSPGAKLIVSESGITSRADLDFVLKYADAALIGTSIMRSGDIESAVKNLIK